MSFSVEITSVQDRDALVAEIWKGDSMVAELRLGADGVKQIEIYPAETHACWIFDFSSWVDALAKAECLLDNNSDSNLRK